MEIKNENEAPTCMHCNKVFTKIANRNRHIRNCHPEFSKTVLVKKSFICIHCNKSFNSKYNLRRHVSKCRNNDRAEKTHKEKEVNCPICNYTNVRRNVIEHYKQEHDIDVLTECIQFNNMSECEAWKNEIERTTVAKFIKCHSIKTGKKCIDYYRCHRDGFYRGEGKNIRNLKSLGSNKINGYCPSKMDVTLVRESGEVFVRFVKTHVGHQMDLARIPLSKADRDSIATKLAQKIPFDEILNDIRDKQLDENNFERYHLLTRKDLYNIEQLYDLKNSVRHTNDCVNSIDSWVREMREAQCDSVVRFYKAQDEEDNQFPDLLKEDFLLIIMSEAQLNTLKEHGNNCICIDSIRGSIKYNCELTTLMVLDDLQQGFPCLFAFSNKATYTILKIVFSILKEILQTSLHPSVFMSDMAETFYNAWSDTMGPVDMRLFSSWRVVEAWKKNITTKIKNAEKQVMVHKTLKTLQEEQNETLFEKMMENFLSNIETDADLCVFGSFFMKTYCSNKNSWAYCYRSHAGLNNNFERIHRTLKQEYVRGRNGKRLDTAISALMELVDEMYGSRHIVLLKGKKSIKLEENRKRHKNMPVFTENVIITDDGNSWVITPAKNQKLGESLSPTITYEEEEETESFYIFTDPENSEEETAPACDNIDGYKLKLDHEEETASACDNVDSYNLKLVHEEETASACDDVDSYKFKLAQKFESILNNITTMDECQIVEEVLQSVLPT